MDAVMKYFGANGIFSGYILLVLICALLVNRIARKSNDKSGDRFLAMLDWFETRGFGTFFHILVLGGVLLMALIGWRIPAEIERIYGQGAGFGLIFPKVDMSMLGRAAQVIGAFGLGIVALRAMRFFVPIFTVIALAVLIWMSVSYIFGIKLPALGG